MDFPLASLPVMNILLEKCPPEVRYSLGKKKIVVTKIESFKEPSLTVLHTRILIAPNMQI